MRDPAKFFTTLRAKAGGKLTPEQVRGTEAVLGAAAGLPLSHAAYMLATAWHETNAKMLPVREAYWLSETWRKRNLKRYYPYYGRGYPQITWKFNYERADAELAKAGMIKAGDLMKDLDLALRPDLAAFIMRIGMVEGWFTKSKDGKPYTLARMLPVKGVATRDQYMQARRIINGMDKADLIEDYAQWFERALRDGGWPQQ